MKKLLPFGAGQLGAAMARLAGTGLELLGFADNDESKCGTFFMSLPVLPPEEALRLRPELVCLCAAVRERREGGLFIRVLTDGSPLDREIKSRTEKLLPREEVRVQAKKAIFQDRPLYTGKRRLLGIG